MIFDDLKLYNRDTHIAARSLWGLHLELNLKKKKTI